MRAPGRSGSDASTRVLVVVQPDPAVQRTCVPYLLDECGEHRRLLAATQRRSQCHRYSPPVAAAESVQKDGMDGVDLAKRWLESTTWVELPFDAYNNAPVCTLRRLDGKVKRYDLFGSIHTRPPTPLYVEVKDYDSSGGKQGADYWAFLANAYSVTAQDLKDGEDARREFMWITRHPFNITDWASLTSPDRIKKALEDHHSEALAGESIDVDLLATVADRLWLLVLHQRQEGLMLTAEELALVESKLNRKAKK